MLNPAEFLRMLRAAIRSECGAGAEPFVRSVVRRAAARGGGVIAFDEDSARTLVRMGLIEAGWEGS
ncbi:MAG: hypothetical protein N3A38_15975, partial [Planctomycetota bacterium]|nr:hypothetical protein [Planctomycetota bacterium]